MEEKYYKVTRKGGASDHDRSFVYHLGLNVHPLPDKKSQDSCGEGLHLWKDLWSVLHCVYAEEIYEARPGVILGEDSAKVRCSYVWLDKLLTKQEIDQLQIKAEEEMRLRKVREELLRGLPTDPICGQDWLNAHINDYTQADIDNLTLVIETDKYKFTLKNKLKSKEIREALSAVS